MSSPSRPRSFLDSARQATKPASWGQPNPRIVRLTATRPSKSRPAPDPSLPSVTDRQRGPLNHAHLTKRRPYQPYGSSSSPPESAHAEPRAERKRRRGPPPEMPI